MSFLAKMEGMVTTVILSSVLGCIWNIGFCFLETRKFLAKVGFSVRKPQSEINEDEHLLWYKYILSGVSSPRMHTQSRKRNPTFFRHAISSKSQIEENPQASFRRFWSENPILWQLTSSFRVCSGMIQRILRGKLWNGSGSRRTLLFLEKIMHYELWLSSFLK